MEVLSEDGKTYEVLPFLLTPERVRFLYSVYQKYDILLSDPFKKDVDAFMDYIMSPGTVLFEIILDDVPVGITYADTIVPKHNANVHYIFWDLRTKGRQRLLLSILRNFMESLDLNRVTMAVPVFAFAALNRLKHMGAWLEGRRRAAVLRNGEWEDQLVFSILRSELTDEVIEDATIDPEKVRGRWAKVLDDEEKLATYFLRKEDK